MTYVPHVRLTLSGEISGGKEIFSCNVGLVSDTAGWFDLLESQTTFDEIGEWAGIAEDVDFDDLVQDCVNFWARPDTGINSISKLTRVKIAMIRPDGRYAGPPKEALVSQVGMGSQDGTHVGPWQISRKCTFETDADLGRVKGGFYLPTPVLAPVAFDSSTDLWLASWTENVRGSVVQFLNDLANEPGIDRVSWKPVVASQGRHNKNGTVRLQPGNHEIKRVSLGRRPDVQRRRANKVSETRVTDQAVSF